MRVEREWSASGAQEIRRSEATRSNWSAQRESGAPGVGGDQPSNGGERENQTKVGLSRLRW